MSQIIKSNKQNILIYIALAVVVSLFFGYYLGVNRTKESREVMFQEVFGDTLFSNNLSGQVLEIVSDKKSLVVEVSGIHGVNLPKEYQKKQILVDSNTKIVLRTKKDVSTLEKEILELKGKEGMIMPVSYVEKEIEINDLVVGDDVNFNFVQDKDNNILNTQFVAIQINVIR